MRYLALTLMILAPAIVEAADYDQRMPATELENGSANAAYRTFIRNGATCYQWGPIRACDGPSTPFRSYSGQNRDRSGQATGSSSDNSDSNNPGGGGTSDPGASDPGGPGSGGDSGNGGDNDGPGGGGGRGQECRR